jgi:hypothetical protein
VLAEARRRLPITVRALVVIVIVLATVSGNRGRAKGGVEQLAWGRQRLSFLLFILVAVFHVNSGSGGRFYGSVSAGIYRKNLKVLRLPNLLQRQRCSKLERFSK